MTGPRDLLTQHSISATAYLDIEGSVGVKVAAIAAVALIYYGESGLIGIIHRLEHAVNALVLVRSGVRSWFVALPEM
jgi:hypothetical protein